MVRALLSAWLAASVFVADAGAQELAPPLEGQRATYQCEGAFGGTYIYEVASVEDGIVHYELTAPKNNHRNLILPIWLLGTSLYKKDYGEGYGKGEMTTGLEAFQALKPLVVGTEVSGDVQEKASGQGTRTWTYSVQIADRKRVQDPVLGDIEIVVIREHRKAGSFSSDREAHLSPAVAELIYSKYSDSDDKKRECHLTALERPK